MVRYLLKRLAQLPFTLLGLYTIIFLILRVMPGDPVAAYLGDVATPDAVAEMRENFGLNSPVYSQYIEGLIDLGSGDLGRSFISRRLVAEEILEVLPNTIGLALAALMISSTFGILFGIIAALKLNKMTDYLVMTFSTLGLSIPVFWLGLMLMFVFSYKLQLFPVAGVTASNSFLVQLWALTLPSIALGFLFMAIVARMTRSSMVAVLNSEFITTVRAKGASERLVIVKHALRNAMVPIVTVIGLNAGLLLGGAVLTEIVFARPGIGKLLVDSVMSSDFPVVQGVILLIGTIYIITNLAVDLVYAFMDPRIEVL